MLSKALRHEKRSVRLNSVSSGIEEGRVDREPNTPRLSVIVPAYNEETRIGATLQRMVAYLEERGESFELIVVSDGSTDNTNAVVNKIAEAHVQLRLLTYSPNRGKGYAVRVGMLAATGERVLFSDADLATPIEEVEKLSEALDKGCDIAIGSRDTIGSELIRRQSFVREMGGRFFNQLVQLIAVPGIHDTQCGFKLFTRRAVQTIYPRCQIDHFAFDVEVLFLARKYGFRISEIPVRWAHQEGSKVRFVRDAIRMLKTLFRIRFTNYGEATSIYRLPTQ